MKMALVYDLVFVDRAIYICEYLPGGLTDTGRPMAIQSPLGAMERARLLMHRRCRWQDRVKGAALFVAYGRFAGRGVAAIVGGSGHPLLVMAGLVPGILLHAFWRRRYG
jgi:hypothetical protein